jgi:hypothetical protein
MELLDTYGPVSVAINAVQNTGFLNYNSGIYAHPSRPKMCDPEKTSKIKIFNTQLSPVIRSKINYFLRPCCFISWLWTRN